MTKPIKIPLEQDVGDVRQKLANLLKIKAEQIASFHLHKQSVDARNKSDVHFVCSYVVETSRKPHNATAYEQPQDVLQQATKLQTEASCVVVGAGPAGLFAALYLVKCGMRVTVVERGSDVSERKAKVDDYFNGGQFDENCNVQFGLGGAGTFSDGKLTTGISSPLTYTVFQQLVRSGAPREILTDALPHVGTDKLVNVVANLRDEIIGYGGKFLFDRTVTDFIFEYGVAKGVVLDGNERLFADSVLLACGHSARDLFSCLNRRGVDVTFKPFAVGLRIEHSREFINEAQYGKLFATHKDLPSASYKLAYNGAMHSCYSFCMCPGGVVVAANSERDTVVVNGMSNYLRNAQNSNSAIVVNVTAEDVAKFGYGTDALSGVRFQQDMERKAYLFAGDYVAPCQNVTDFIANRVSGKFDLTPSYPRGVKSVNLRELLPAEICDTICQALEVFEGKIKGFGSSGVLTGVESRTSSPVRIVRDATFQSNVRGLYPTGEGAGYAGGIVSSAVDGLKVAMAICKAYE